MLGPHFYYDVIRLARKGWPTLLRVVYLAVMLLSLAVLYQGGGRLVKPRDFAVQAQSYANLLITVQYVLILLLMPVYVASAVAEEKENATLEALALTHLTDTELILGKLGARLAHVALLLLSGFPLLAFMHLWGNVDVSFLLYHEANSFLLLLLAGSACITISSASDGVFQAVSRSYPWMCLLGLVVLLGAYVTPLIAGAVVALVRRTGSAPTPVYLPALVLGAGAQLALAYLLLEYAVRCVAHARRVAARKVRKPAGSLLLTDGEAPRETPGRKGRWRSRIHPLALPVRDPALFWKECLKDGTRWSLTYRWAVLSAAVILGVGLLLALVLPYDHEVRVGVRILAGSFAYTAYFVALAAYALVVLFQTTMSVAGEQEQDTLVFLLLIPEERHSILFAKWLGPLWRNWPVLAVAGLGVLVGLAGGVYGPVRAAVMLLLPWPLLLMLSLVSLWLSVTCRRVLFANLGLVGLLLGLVIVHIAAWTYLGPVLAYYLSLLFDSMPLDPRVAPRVPPALVALGEQVGFLYVGFVAALLAYRRFLRADYAAVR